jgi:preprotein translocase subunit SecE
MSQILKFLTEVRAEFKNISWPKRESLINLTIVVISISIIVSLILGGFDLLFTQGMAYFGEATRPAPKVDNSLSLPTLEPSPVVTATVTPKPTLIKKVIKK